jgi:hypothetical protein
MKKSRLLSKFQNKLMSRYIKKHNEQNFITRKKIQEVQ